MGLPWAPMGFHMGLPWAPMSAHESPIGLSPRSPVGFHGSPIGVPWVSRQNHGHPRTSMGTHGLAMGLPPMGFHGFPMGSYRLSWNPMGLRLVSHGSPIGCPRVAHGLPMGCPRVAMADQWTSIALPWGSHGISYRIRPKLPPEKCQQCSCTQQC